MGLFNDVHGKNAKQEKPTIARKFNQQPVKTESLLNQVIAKEVRDEQAELVRTNNELHRKQQEFKRRRILGGQ